MSFSRARRFKYSISPLEKGHDRKPRENERSENAQIADLVENYRQRNLLQTAINDFKKSPKSQKENTFKVVSTPEKFTKTKAAYSSNYHSSYKATKNNTNFNNSYSEVDGIVKEVKWTDWNYVSKELVDIKKDCNKLQSLLMGSSEEYFDLNRTFFSSTKVDETQIYNRTSDIFCEAEKIINSGRNKLKKTVAKNVYAFRKETEGKTKAFVEDINNGNRIFLDKLQNEFDNIAEDLSEDISKICKRVNDANGNISEEEKGTKESRLREELKESKRYIRFLENKFKELLISADKKVSEQEELINILKAELEETFLGDKLQDVLLKQHSCYRQQVI